MLVRKYYIWLLLLILLAFCRFGFAADVVKTIGASGADYTTIALWEDDLDDGTNAAINTTAYSSSDVAIGELIDSSYTEQVVINEGDTVGLSGIILRPASGNVHDGTFESGATWNVIATGIGLSHQVAIDLTVEDIEFRSDLSSGTASFSDMIICNGAATHTIRRCLFYCDGGSRSSGGARAINVTSGASGQQINLYDCLAHQITQGPSGPGAFIVTNTTLGIDIANCTAVDCWNGINMTGGTTGTQSIRNNIMFNSGNNDYAGTFDTNTTNYSSDGTVSTTTTSQTEAQLFEDVANGDFTPASGSDLVDNGTDLGTTNEVNVDIFQYDRDAGGVTWDVGAAELQSAGSTPMLIFMQHYRRR